MINFGAYLFLFYVFAVKVSYIISTTLDTPDTASLCPHIDFCTEKAKLSIEYTSGLESCCQKCSCAPDCHVVGSCCPDHPNKTQVAPEYACVSLNSLLNNKRSLYGIDDAQSFHVVDRCLNRTLGYTFRECEFPSSLEDYVLVSDAKNEKVFKNRHCALCNHVNEFVEWDLVAKCPDLLKRKFQTFDERDAFVLSSCKLDARPPNQHVRRLSTCYPTFNLIRYCPSIEVKEGDLYAENIRKACRGKAVFENTVVRKGSKVYSNVYCYSCNNPEETDIGLCPTPDKEAEDSLEVSFAGIIRKANDAQHTEDKQCKLNEVWDSFARVCRNLYCPLGKIPVDGTCEDSLLYSEGYPFFLLFKVASEESGSTFFLTENSLQSVEKHVRKLLEINSTCGVCRPDIFQEQSNTFLRLHMYTKADCSISHLIEHARSLVSRNENMTMFHKNNVQELPFVLTFTTERMPFVGRTPEQLAIGKNCLHPATQIDLSILQDCPSILVPVDELLNVTAGGLSFLYPSGLVSVCLEMKMSSSVTWHPLNGAYPLALLLLLISLNV